MTARQHSNIGGWEGVYQKVESVRLEVRKEEGEGSKSN